MYSSFRTPIPPSAFTFSIQHQDILLAMGSCFADHLGKKLLKAKFDLQLNPFGIIYNPISLANSLEHIINKKEYTPKDLFQHQDLWHSFDHHGSFSSFQLDVTLQQINEHLTKAQEKLSRCNRLLITFGTAYVFHHVEQDRVVANCHKLPGQLFERKLLPVEAITTRFHSIFSQLKAEQEQLEIILTVSPVRHLRDGFVGNQRSKATLLLAVDQLEQAFPFVHYYPAYELLLDDLRDYRFYDADMIHPNNLAVNYIWTHFQSSFFTDATKDLVVAIEKINKAITHRPFHPEGTDHQHFLKNQLGLIKRLLSDHPFLDFSAEEELLKRQLVG
jgi:hypothetical protein